MQQSGLKKTFACQTFNLQLILQLIEDIAYLKLMIFNTLISEKQLKRWMVKKTPSSLLPRCFALKVTQILRKRCSLVHGSNSFVWDRQVMVTCLLTCFRRQWKSMASKGESAVRSRRKTLMCSGFSTGTIKHRIIQLSMQKASGVDLGPQKKQPSGQMRQTHTNRLREMQSGRHSFNLTQ